MVSSSGALARGFLIAAPYWVGAVVLYLASFVFIGTSQLGITLHPSGLGLVLPALVAGAGGLLGAGSLRSVKNAVAVPVIRGTARAVIGVVVGIVVTALIAGAWIALESVTQANGQSPQSGVSLTPAERDLGWSLVALIPFYIGNIVCIGWSAALGGVLFSASPWHPVIYLGPIIGAIVGSLQLRRLPDRLEQGSYALAFALITGLIGIVTTPAITNGPSLLQTGWTSVLVALVVGGSAALVGPYLLGWKPIDTVANGSAMTWLVRPLLALWPREGLQPSDFIDSSPRMVIPVPRLGRTSAIVASVLVVLVAGGVFANVQLSARFSPEAAAVEYLQAQSRGDATSVWSMVSYEGSSASSTPLLSEDALRKMLTYAANTGLSNIRVRDSARQDDSNFLVNVLFTKSGQPTSIRLHVRRDTSRSNWLLYPSWRIVIPSSAVQITSFLHAGAITVDGFPTGLSDSSGRVEVIPGQHEVDLASTDIFDADHQIADAANDTSVTFKATLTSQATIAVQKAISDLFTRCASGQVIAPTNCPNSSYAFGDHQSSVHWSLVGDPTSAMQLSIADQLDTITASGQWKMHLTFDYWYDFDSAYVQHWNQDVSGYFNDTLHWNGSGFDITSQGGY
jgi:hypothetical protein